MKKGTQNNNTNTLEELSQKGSLGILALGYKGIEMWRANRPKIEEEKEVEKADNNEEKA